MKKLLILSFVAMLSFGFTFSGDTNVAGKSECPYINKIQSIGSNNGCPFLKNHVDKKLDKNEEKMVCPYKGEVKNGSSECPYLKDKGNIKSSETKPSKIIKLKVS